MYLAHFYGRAAAGPSFSDRVLRTFTGTLTTVISYNNLKPYLYSGDSALFFFVGSLCGLAHKRIFGFLKSSRA
jgi:hypothetical protein